MTRQRTIKLTGMALSAVLILALQAIAGETRALTSRHERQNYSAGVDIARSLKQQAGEVNLDILLQGLRDELMGEKLLMNEDELRTSLAERKAEPAQRQEQAAVKRDEMKAKATEEVAKTANATPGDNSAIKQVPTKDGRIAPKKVGTSLVERSRMRSEIKKRAAEMRRQIIEQERQGAENAPSLGAI